MRFEPSCFGSKDSGSLLCLASQTPLVSDDVVMQTFGCTPTCLACHYLEIPSFGNDVWRVVVGHV